MKVKKSTLVLMLFIISFTTIQVHARSEISKDEFDNLLEKVQYNIPMDWNVAGYGFYPESQGTIILVMNSNTDSAAGRLNPLLEKFEEAEITDFYAVEQSSVDKNVMKKQFDDKMWLYLGNSKLEVISTEKRSMKIKSADLITKLVNCINGGNRQELPGLYAKFIENSDARSKYVITKTMLKKNTWENGKVCMLIFGEWHGIYGALVGGGGKSVLDTAR